MATNLSKPMLFLLRQMVENDPKDGMSESLLAYESEFFGGVKHEGSSFHLADKAADKTLAALERRGLIAKVDGYWQVTNSGKDEAAVTKVAALVKAPESAIRDWICAVGFEV